MNRDRARTFVLLRALLYFALVTLAYLALRRIASVLAPVYAGLALAYLLDPLVSWLARRGIPRWAAVILLVAAVAGAIAALLLFVPPLIASELRAFGERWHEYQTRLDKSVLPWLRTRLHLPRGSTASDLLVNAFGRVSTVVQGASVDLATALGRALDTAESLLRLLVSLLLTPIFAVSFLLDFPALGRRVLELVPPRHRPSVSSVVGEVDRALHSWLRGQLTAVVILAALYAVGLSVVGIPLGTGIGILTGVLAFIPYLGVVVGFGLAIIAALLDYHGAASLVGVVATFAVVQTCDTLFITPQIVGSRVGLSPVAVIFALSLGGELLGYLGVLIAVPAAAVCVVLLGRARRAYQGSLFYTARVAAAPTSSPATSAEASPPSRHIEGGHT